MRILIIRPGAIGDSLLTFPVIQALRAQYPAPHVTFVSNPAVLPLARVFGIAEEVDDYGAQQWSELFSTAGIQSQPLQDLLRRTDMAICWLRDPDGIVEHNLRAIGIKRIMVAPGRPADNEHIHVVDHLARTVDVGAQFIAPCTGVDIRTLKGAMNWAPTTLPLYDHYIAIHPGSGGARKCWPVSRFAAIVAELWQRNIPVLLLAGPADAERLTALLSSLTSPPQPSLLKTMVNAPLLEVAQQLQQCRGYLGNDSGITHLAALLGVPTVVLFGPSDPAIWRPIGSSVRVLHEPFLENLHADAVIRTMTEFFL